MRFGKIVCGLAALSACAAFLVACSKGGEAAQKDDGKLNIYTWTYYTPEDAVKQFEQEFGIHVTVDEYASNEEMYAKLRAGGGKGYDIVVPSQDYSSIMIKQGMLREIDQSKFTNKGNINPRVLEKATYDPTMKYCVPYYFGAAGISVNKTKVPGGDYPRDWSIFADKRFAGHATMMDDMREVIGDALVSLGYDVNSLDDAQLEQAKQLIVSKWKPNLVKFDAESFGKSFASGDFWLCQGYAEVIYGEVSEDKQEDMIDFFIPAEGGPAYLDSLCILKDSQHYAAANEFINFIHRPEIYAMFLDYFRFPCFVNPAAEQYMTSTPMYEADEMLNCELKLDLGEGLDKYNGIWQDVRFAD